MSSPSKSNSDPEHQTNELEAARNLLRATLDASTDMIQVFEAVRDDQGAITDFIWKLNNHASEKIYGDVVGKRLLQLQPGVVEEGIFDAFKRVVETGEAQQYEKHYVHEQFDGWFHQSVVKLNDGVTATTADITSRKNAEAEIIRLKDEIAQKTEDKYRSIFNAIEEGYCLVEVILNDDGKPVDEVFLEMNPAYEKHTGLTKDILGKRTSQIVPNREPEWAEFFGNVAISGEPAFIEYHLNEIDRWLSAHASRVGGAGSLKVAIVFQDITERKRREMRLAFLAEVTNVFANLSNPDEIMQTVGEKLGAYLQITTVNFTDVNEAEDKVRVHYGWSDASVPSTVDTFRLSQYLDEGFVRTSHAGETVVIRDTQTDPRTDAAGYAALSMYSFVTVPFHNQGKWTHYIAVCHSQVRDWRKDEVELIEEISNRIFPRLEKARAEEALRESEEKFRTLFHSIDEGFLIHEMIRDESGQAIDFRLMEVNPAFTRQTGLGREMIGKLNSEYAPKTEKFWLETFDRVAHTGTPESVENYHQDTDRWYRVHVSKVGGQDSRIAAVFEDITERKQRERQQEFLLKFSDALRSEQGAHAVANRALEMLVEELRLDRSYITTYYLDEDRARLDYQIGNDTVLPLPEYFVLSDYPEAFKSTFDKTLVIDDELERQGLSEAERRNSGNLGMRAMVAATLHKENKPLWSMVAINSRPRSWTAGEIALVEAVAERTWAAIEHAKSEETLRHADERYRAMTDNVPVLIWETDESGLISCNRHYTDFFGVSFEEVRGMGWAKSLHPDDVEAYTAAYRKAFERGESYSYECRLRRADGEYRWLLTTGHPLNENRFVGFCADITEKKRAEEALRESEEKFRTLFNSIDEGFAIQEVVTDKNGNVTDVIWRESNRAFENLSGMKDVVGKKASEYLPNLEQNWLNALTQVFKTGEPLRNEDFTADLNRWIAYQYSRIGEAGSPLIGVVFDDITERKRRELNTALLDEIGKDLSILSAPDEIMQAVGARLGRCLNLGVVVFVDVDEARGEAVVHHGWDKEGELNLRNQTYRLVDYLTEDFMRDMRAGEISVVRDPATDKRVSGDAYAAVNVGAWVSVPFHRNGQWKAFITMTDVAPRNWRADEIALVRNIAERVFPRIERARAEEALLESKKRFQSIANLVPDLLWDSEPDGATNWYNDRWLEYTGQTLEEAIGWGWTDAIHPDDREGSAMRYNQAVEAGKLLRQEHRIRRRDGQYRWFAVNVSPLLDEIGRVVKMYGVASDIHDLKRLEADLLQASRRKDEFLAMLAHELRNPLSTVRNGLSILQITQQSDPQASEIVAMMDAQATHLVRMIDDLLDVSRVTQGKIELKMERLEIDTLIGNAVRAIRPQFENRRKALHTSSFSHDLFVQGDSTRLSQVITNLLTNSLRYTGDDGRVWVSLTTKDNEAVISVKDNGIGLTAEQQTSVFDLFVQADNSLARTQGGLGIGLTLVRQLVEMHSGRAVAKSPGIGQGSEFLIYLPLLESPSTAAAEQNAVLEKSLGLHVLLIDDMEDLAKMTSMLLKLKGYRVDIRHNGRTGAEAVEALKPEVVFCDIGMPVLDGYQTARLIREGNWGARVALVALSGYGQREDKQRAQQAGFDGHLVKPVSIEDLEGVIAAIADRGSKE